ncbi:gamma-glutamylcyclotransferase [Haliovirga abyssi]|uniref:Gamma-glutamylcyclotransferase AIG2-like domain-containing protein n=1 Tax=Haliovirga abyssi TaxID=2996794 RepID=A0AAU9DEH5_9FUSO|nr:gamma-glutamylcyclotransferase [Haliovirga abyssi]BDU50747.1 hypothetical protein HLVA_13160 [Haliovirga abyssi]
MEINFLFVYGKLRELYIDKENLEIESLITLPVKTKGELYSYDDSAVLFDSEDGFVYGNLLVASDIDKLLRRTDFVMEFNENDYSNSKYVRINKKVFIDSTNEEIDAWMYIFPTSRKTDIAPKSEFVKEEDWLKYKERKAFEENAKK